MVAAKTMSRKTVMMVVLINSKLKTFVYDLAKIVMMVEKLVIWSFSDSRF